MQIPHAGRQEPIQPYSAAGWPLYSLPPPVTHLMGSQAKQRAPSFTRALLHQCNTVCFRENRDFLAGRAELSRRSSRSIRSTCRDRPRSQCSHSVCMKTCACLNSTLTDFVGSALRACQVKVKQGQNCAKSSCFFCTLILFLGYSDNVSALLPR